MMENRKQAKLKLLEKKTYINSKAAKQWLYRTECNPFFGIIF